LPESQSLPDIFRGVRRWILAVGVGLPVFATGAAGLVYQVAFERYLARLVGNDHVAVGLTLGTFLGALALGYLLCGRLTLMIEEPLRAYALLEALIGVWGLAFPRWFERVESVAGSWGFEQPWGLAFEGLAVSGLLIGPPTVLMGATVPFLTRGLGQVHERVSSTHAAVYALNTAGAFVGVLLAGFFLVPAFGLPATVRGTALVNLLAGAMFLALSFYIRGPAVSLGGIRPRTLAAGEPFSPRRLYGVALLSGLAVLTLEAVAVRIGKLVLGGSTYTFAMVVAVFVLGIAAGSLAVARAPRLPRSLLFGLQAGAACWLLLLLPTLDLWPYAAHVLRVAFQATPVGFWLHRIAVLVALAVPFLPPAALLGATLPTVFHELDAGLNRSGWISGRLLAWNGVGTLLGSLCGSFLLYHFLDAVRVFLLVPLVASVAAVLVSTPVGRMARGAAWAMLLVATAAIVVRPFHDDSRFAVGTFRLRTPEPYSLHGPRLFFEERMRGMRLERYEDGPTDTVAVLDQVGDRESRALFVNGKSESSTNHDAVTLRLLAHLPALWAERRARVLVVGLGTGVTAGELSLYPELERIDVAEISPAVVRALPWFTADTHGVERDERLRVHVRDAWLVLRQSPETWDVITSEPSNPWVSGVDQLFTREFYRLVASRLAEGGVFVQWVQLYESDFESLALVLNSLRAELPTLHAFRGMTGDLLLLAARRPFDRADRLRAEEVLAGHSAVADSLREIGIESIAQILEREVTSLPTLLRQGARYGFNTMDHPRLHYLAGRNLFLGSGVSEDMLRGVTNLDFVFEPGLREQRERP